MTRRAVDFSAAARVDILNIWNYLADSVSIEVADKIVSDFEAEIQAIAATPGVGHTRPDLTERHLLFHNIHSYLIVYRPDRKPLNVLRIVHASRDVKRLLSE